MMKLGRKPRLFNDIARASTLRMRAGPLPPLLVVIVLDAFAELIHSQFHLL